MKDDAIIELYLKRDEQAIQFVSEKYGHYCHTIAERIVFDRLDAEECVNDTWLASWKRIPPTQPTVLSSFLGKITRGFAIDCFRKKAALRRMDTHICDIDGEIEKLEDAVAYTIEDQLKEKEIIEQIDLFLQKQNTENRDIFIRRYWFMDTIEEIAKRHGKKRGAISIRLLRMRNKLYEELKGAQLYE